jgi:hypothetical protein
MKTSDIKNQLEKVYTLLISAMAKNTIYTISDKAKNITDSAKLETSSPLWL